MDERTEHLSQLKLMTAEAEELSYGILLGQHRILELLVAGSPLEQILEEFCLILESLIGGVICCIMLPEFAAGKLRVAAAPTLPREYRSSIDGLNIGPQSCSCGTAVHRNDIVIVEDIESDPLWEGHRGFALKHGLRSCWSTPVRGTVRKSEAAEVAAPEILGTFALYYTAPHRPTNQALKLLGLASNLVSLVIQNTQARETIRQQAYYDSLTGLPNRSLFEDRLRHAITESQRRQGKLAVLVLDLDHFKDINNTLGYRMGDFLLRSVANRLTETVRTGDTVARFGGDEFALLIQDIKKAEDAREISEKIISAVNSQFDFGGHELFVASSVGVSLYPWDGEDSQSLLKNAETALFHAKEKGRNRYEHYTPEMFVGSFDRLQLSNDLRRALERNELLLHYMPQLKSGSGEIIRVEALIRWIHPTHGLLMPGKFIPLAEELGQILPIGEWVLRTACRQSRRWSESGFENIGVAVNISPLQFRQPRLVEKVTEILNETGLTPECLELEITESIAMQDIASTLPKLVGLKGLGVRISIDDFGKGYSSLGYLKRLPVDTLKIDQSFVRDVTTNADNSAIVRAVISLAHNLEKRVVAEGVETQEQVGFLRLHRCDYLQGFLFGRPVPEGELTPLLRKTHTPTTGRCYFDID